MAGSAPPLLERDRELEALGRLLEDVGGGRGGVLLIEGGAGVGKTRLLSVVDELARSSGVRVLTARGSEFEQQFGFGVVRQLFEPVLRGLSTSALNRLLRAAAGPAGRVLLEAPGVSGEPLAAGDPAFGVLHGLYWLLVNLSDDAPVVVMVDDVQWADQPSQRFLFFCAARTAGVPVGVVVANRAGRHGSGLPLVALSGLPEVVRLAPQPLSPAGVGQLLHDWLGADPDDSFLEACRLATGGVPFYACELAEELARERIAPTASNAGRVAQVRPDSLVRAVVARIAGLGDPAVAVARAVSITGGSASAEMVVALSGLERPDANRAVDQLEAAGIFSAAGAEFRHPILAGSVYTDIPFTQRGELHARAAGVLRAAGAPADQVAAHLLRARPSGDSAAVDTLRTAAAQAIQRGATAEAVILVERALNEPPSAELRPPILLELGTAQLRAGLAQSAETLREALKSAEGPLRAQVGLALGQALSLAGRAAEAGDLADALAAEMAEPDPGLSLRLRVVSIIAGRFTAATAPASLARLQTLQGRADSTSGESSRIVAAILASSGTLTNQPAAQMAKLALDAMGDGDILTTEPPDSPYQWLTPIALILTDEFTAAGRAIARLAAVSQRQGSLDGLGAARMLGSLLALRQGALLNAESDAWEALTLTSDRPHIAFPFALGVAIEVAIERGNLEEAERLVGQAVIPDQVSDNLTYCHYLVGRARLLLAQRQWRRALEELLSVGRRLEDCQVTGPARIAWRSQAALAALRLGDRATATRLAGEELQLAESYGAARALGIALRAAGLVAEGDEAIGLLERAAQVLDGRAVDLEYARVLVELGGLLHRRRAVDGARKRLRVGLDLAVRCGATPLAEQARQELQATGARPRRTSVTGAAALTAAERRVSQLAADGLTNRDIAQSLFVSVKAVELHLTNSYRKLGIANRAQLGAALAAGDERQP